MANFDESLLAGRKVEHLVLDRIKNKYPSAVLIENKFAEYDIFVPENDTKIEVKLDKKSQFTGNLVVELFMFGKPSGILKTTADYWYWETGKNLLIAKPKKIIECLLMNNIRTNVFIGKGDTHPKTACLVKIELLKRYCESINPSLFN
tara:strand:+ start:5580 stop:6023 length:444 start_codon:yes stop_codon:yes gene_type:complete